LRGRGRFLCGVIERWVIHHQSDVIPQFEADDTVGNASLLSEPLVSSTHLIGVNDEANQPTESLVAKKTVFISYDFDNDRNYKNMLLAWDNHDEFDFELYDGSLKTAIDSNDAAYIKSVLKPLIQKASHLLCIVGKEGGTNKWIEWEVATAVGASKKLIGVKLDKSYTSPPSLLNNKATWAMSFTFDAIKKAIDDA
jgi:hypothetical protein